MRSAAWKLIFRSPGRNNHLFKKYSFVQILPGYSCETRSRSVVDKYTGAICQVIKEASASGYLDLCSTGFSEEINVHQDRCVPFERHAVKVTFADGDYIETAVNGSRESISRYYLDNHFERGQVAKVEFHVDIVEPPPVDEKPYVWMSDFVKNERDVEWVKKHT